MATKYLAKTFKYGALAQTNWATPQAAGANFISVNYDGGVTVFDPDINVELYNTVGQNGIHKEFERVKVDGRSGLPKVNFSGVADIKSTGIHLGQALLAVSQGAASAFTKTITAAGLTGTVDFNGNDVTLFTIAMDDKASADDGIVLENAIIENVTISFDFLANGLARLGQISGNWVGNEMNFEQTTNGTWTNPSMTPLNNTDLYTMTAFTVDGQDWTSQNIRAYSFSVANNVTSGSATTAGKANNYDIAPVYTSKISLDYNATTEKVLKDFQDGATVVATIDSSLGGGTIGNLTIACTGGIMQSQPFSYNREFASVELDILWHSTAAATPATITVTDFIDWGY